MLATERNSKLRLRGSKAPGKADTAQYVHGILLYIDAKPDFDGLIAQLKLDLISGQDPATSSKFASMLEAAAGKRIAFANYLTEDVVGGLTGAPKLAGCADSRQLMANRLDRGGARRTTHLAVHFVPKVAATWLDVAILVDAPVFHRLRIGGACHHRSTYRDSALARAPPLARV